MADIIDFEEAKKRLKFRDKKSKAKEPGEQCDELSENKLAVLKFTARIINAATQIQFLIE